MFIEKPISISEVGIDELQNIVRNNHVICQVGFQHRYNPAIIQARKWVLQGKIGNIVSVDVEVGERIERMHAYEDYREMAESRSDLGGGVVLCQCHELDIIFWFFGYPSTVYSIGGTAGAFDINVEDTADTLLRYRTAENNFSVRIHQDFIQSPVTRRFKIIGSKGIIQADILRYQASLINYCGEEELYFRNDTFKRNDMFITEMQSFIDCVDSRHEPLCNMEVAYGATRIGMAIKESMFAEKEVLLDDI